MISENVLVAIFVFLDGKKVGRRFGVLRIQLLVKNIVGDGILKNIFQQKILIYQLLLLGQALLDLSVR